jgi:hypothetical protein
MPVAPSPMRRAGSVAAGGTAVRGDELWRWAPYALLASVLLALIVLAVTRSSEPAAAVAALDAGELTEEDEEAGEEAAVDDEEVPAAEPAASPEEEAARDAAVDDLSTVLRQQRLWANVERDADDPGGVTIETAYCEDKELRGVLAGVTPRLREAGFSRIRCRARHGSVEFEQQLD